MGAINNYPPKFTEPRSTARYISTTSHRHCGEHFFPVPAKTMRSDTAQKYNLTHSVLKRLTGRDLYTQLVNKHFITVPLIKRLHWCTSSGGDLIQMLLLQLQSFARLNICTVHPELGVNCISSLMCT